MRIIRVLFALLAVALLLSGCGAGVWLRTSVMATPPSVMVSDRGDGQIQLEPHYDLGGMFPPTIEIKTLSYSNAWLPVFGNTINSISLLDPNGRGRVIWLMLTVHGVVNQAKFVYDGRDYPVGAENNWQTWVPNNGDNGRHRLDLKFEYKNDQEPERWIETTYGYPWYIYNNQ